MSKKISRRDAIKLLGAAAGATLLANLPTKWNKPSIAGGVLPAHAQTSCFSLTIEVLSATANTFLGFVQGPNPDEVTGDGFTGSTITWYCQSGCFFMGATMLNGNSMTWRFTTLAGQFTVVWDGNTPSHTVAIDLGTGEYAVDDMLLGGACENVFRSAPSEGSEVSFW